MTETVPGPGRREQRKDDTRRALEEAALRRFATDGYDATSVDAIAADAGVSARTFFRYFPAKDDVFDMGREVRQAELRSAIRARRDLTDGEVVREAVLVMARGFAEDRDRVLLRQGAAASSVVLRGRIFDTFLSWEFLVARELGGTPEAEALAAAGIAVFRAAAARWVHEGGSLPDRVAAGFDALGVL
ncbi:TetR family transcriptional regulator [Nocardioides sp. SR21]|uniref:TetR family transcriptional regulator n=1 Tax=Nocardioides sp. SR21 TaxID=2919501 RepID=UPI001FAA0BFC|nr:TetR family transcriptional regulator [Nocardioides sp. SR21]